MSSWRTCSRSQLLDPPQTLGWDVSRAPVRRTFHFTSPPPPDTDPDGNPKRLSLPRVPFPGLLLESSAACCDSENCAFHAFAGNSYIWLNIREKVLGQDERWWGQHKSPESITTEREGPCYPVSSLRHVWAQGSDTEKGRDHFPPPVCFQHGRGKFALFLWL